MAAICASPESAAIPAQSRQLLVVTTADWLSVEGMVQRYENMMHPRRGRRWGRPSRSRRQPRHGVGMDWSGIPAHTNNDPLKRDGDGKSPAGVFSVSSTFGYASLKPPTWEMPYRQLTLTTECVDDRDSKFHNQIVERSGDTGLEEFGAHALGGTELQSRK